MSYLYNRRNRDVHVVVRITPAYHCADVASSILLIETRLQLYNDLNIHKNVFLLWTVATL
jgi:hypothetical protein